MSAAQLVLVVLCAIVVTAVAQRKDLQPALVITVVALGASFIPGIPRLELDPEVILSVLLPPLLYSAALGFSFVSFFRRLGSILQLGVGLVVVTAGVAGLVGSWTVAGLSFGSAVVLGAAVAPPDAVSAIAIGSRLGLRKRVLAILTGESLVNDAAALTVFTVAVSSVAGTHRFIDSPLLLFAYSAAVGIVVGVVVAKLAMRVRSRLENPGLETVLGLVVPFAAYLLAEALEASGVLAVVAAGFVVGTSSARVGYETRMQERDVWDALVVALEAFVFAYVGLQLRFVLDDLSASGASVAGTLGAGVLVLLAVMLIRPLYLAVFLGPTLVVRDDESDPGFRRAKRRWDRVVERHDRRGMRPAMGLEVLTWREGVVIAWTGMRGVVTLAAAAAVPAAVPGRPQIQAIAFVVAVGTLLVQGATLPWLIRRLDVRDPREAETEDRLAREVLDVARDASDGVYQRFIDDPPPGVSSEMVRRIGDRFAKARDAATAAEAERRRDHGPALARFLGEVSGAQRRAVVDARDAGELDDDAVRAFLEQLDLQEAAVASRTRRL